MYRELLYDLIKDHDWASLQDPCPESEIAAAEAYVGYPFPEELKALLRETNGDHWFLLSAKEIMENVERNRTIMAEYLEPEEFLEKVDRFVCFATNGCGDYYCYRVLENGETDTSAVCMWEHELLEARPVAKDLADAITKYYHEEI